MTKATAIGISLGTQVLAAAVIENGELLTWEQKSFRKKWSRKKLFAILSYIDRLIVFHDADTVAIKIPDCLPTSKAFNQLIGSINVFAESKPIKVKYYSLSEVKQLWSQQAKMTKRDMAIQVIQTYPELTALCRDRSKGRPYHYKVFEATATAHISFKASVLQVKHLRD